MADFFIEVGNRRRGGRSVAAKLKDPRKRKREGEGSGEAHEAVESLSGDEEGGGRGGDEAELSYSDDLEKLETPAQKRARLARQYIEAMAGSDDDDGSGSGSGDDGSGSRGGRRHEAVGDKLYEAALRASHRYRQEVADTLGSGGLPDGRAVSASHGKHRLPVTAVAVAADESVVYSGSKDGAIVAWDLESDTKWVAVPAARAPPKGRSLAPPTELGDGHAGAVLALAVADNPAVLASTGEDGTIRIWDTRAPPRTLLPALSNAPRAHKGPVYGLAFRHATDQLFSGGVDRVVKVWAGSEAAFVESLFGHEAAVHDMDSLVRERAISGSADGSIRVWKVLEQSQLLFRAPGGGSPVERVSLINENNFAVATVDGSLSLFSVHKRRALTVVKHAHGAPPCSQLPESPLLPPGEVTQRSTCNWATALESAKFTDVIASGSATGTIKFWKVGNHCKSLTPVAEVDTPGFVNDLAWARSGKFVVAAVGREHRLGRWWRLPGGEGGARNRVSLIRVGIDLDAVTVGEEEPLN
ncbi:U3 small nucleolar RNA-interacting protein 2 [Thecamonas trahens ATCC 50062]|uniref:U3 small nucleolar RNA-interacting protein 2 n=1 Tax=Thecamonas trahens ATCC 50062 TaxID=461836 RepID=A0A0L0DAN2_THETB|nr:U3 small nucleolar RNA-interacting protein 2 [Thecamonas trahens ATCC 50062]KNC49414.1 U3 small nucleolar RNA-interacting protein 2 [Thecamonas trahens ATCC 50062]|eukprot:XP_013757838.1 U3 small nucleolar RNA-interacting protein 2 [Thecamonas trahens ATCC 50062]